MVNGLVALANMTRMPCYSSFLATTRVSNQLNAISEDFAFGGMKKCGLAIDADCLGGHQLVLDLNATYTIPPFEWNYTVSVTNLYAPQLDQLKGTRHVVLMVIVCRGYNDLIDVVVELNDAVLYDVGTLKSLETFAENGTISTNTSDIDMVFKAEATGNVAYSVVDSSNPCSSPVPYSGGGLSPGKSHLNQTSILHLWLTQDASCS